METEEIHVAMKTTNSEMEEKATTETIEDKAQKEEKEEKNERVPMKGDGKWEKKPVRSSTRTHKKPNWLGNNLMMTKIELESSAGESLPSGFEIPAPKSNCESLTS